MIDNGLPTNEIVNIVADLILAAADTVSELLPSSQNSNMEKYFVLAYAYVTMFFLLQTSHASQWALYSLAKHPECQERILKEINQVVPKGEMVNNTHVQQIPYLAKTIKETLR